MLNGCVNNHEYGSPYSGNSLCLCNSRRLVQTTSMFLHFEYTCLYVDVFWEVWRGDWGLSSGLHAYNAGVLLLELHFQSILL
jgi:hypothetical protein